MCGCSNCKNFRFCQFCGFKKLVIDEDVGRQSLETYNAQRRLAYLDNMLNSRSYNKKRNNLKKEFESFLKVHSKSLISATPEDVRLFLV